MNNQNGATTLTGKVIFILSLVFSTLFLLLERLVGMGIDFHPDAVTYLTVSDIITENVMAAPMSLFNHAYYVLAYATGMSGMVLISINIMLFSLTNMMLFNSYKTLYQNSDMRRLTARKIHVLLFIVFIFSLYRLHLSGHVLKDTMVVFLTTLMVTNQSRFKYLYLVPIAAFRLFGSVYFALFLKGKALYFTLFIVLILSYVFQQVINVTLLEFNAADLNFRAGTAVPTFQNLGIVGVFLRMLIWPALLLSGAFLALSPSPLFVPIALSSLTLQIWSMVALRRVAFTASAYGLMALLAALAPGFASYQRYCLPIITLLPILMLQARK